MSVSKSGNDPSDSLVSSRAEIFWGIWAVVAAFGTYFCMYAFRKPFTAASFDETLLWGLDFKTILIISQVAGYMVSKFLGIKVISEMPPNRRALGILVLISIAQIALLAFGLIPRPWNAIGLFFNGLALGMVFGLVLGYLEGRKLTEALTAGLCCSFILADGVMKSVGTWLLGLGVIEDWMPFTAGLVFALPLGISLLMLAVIPAPTLADQAERSVRPPMNQADRWSLLNRYGLGLGLLVAMYLVVTIVRSVRADFAPEIWAGLGTEIDAGLFTRSEMLVALGVLFANGALICIRNSRTAFFGSLVICLVGISMMALTMLAWQADWIGGFPLMVMLGLGLYLPYVAIHTTVFERFLAMTRDRGNIGFLMYLADSIGYLGYIGVMVARKSVSVEGDFIDFFVFICWACILIAALCLGLGWWYFAIRCPAEKPVAVATEGVG
ncbi:MAG: DUF5690 family protein [Pirellulaceae bacterium]